MRLLIKQNPGMVERIFILSVILIFLAVATLIVTEYLSQNKLAREEQLISQKVLRIMQMYNCQNQEIYDAIMETFDPVLIATIIAIESEYQINAISPAGCRGLMQLTPDKLNDWRDPRKNIKTGAAYFQSLLDRFQDLDLAMAAYNAGPEMVSKYQGIPPFRETRNYIKKVKLLAMELDHFISYQQQTPPQRG